MAKNKKFDMGAYRKKLKEWLLNPNKKQLEEPTEGVVYKIEHKESSKIYVGITTRDPEIRWKEHGKCIPSRKGRSLINQAILKYGKEAFSYEVVAIAYIKALKWVESNYIDYYNCIAPNGYNLITRSNTPNAKKLISESTRKKMSDASKLRIPWNKGTKGLQKAWNKGQLNGKWSKPIVVINNETGEVTKYPSSMEAVRKLNLNSGHVTQCCKGNLKHHKGYTFKYLKDYRQEQGGSDV